MDPIEPGKGQEEPAEHLMLSSRGRQRKKNPKYSDYETADALQEQETQTKSSRGGRGAAKSPARNGTRHTEGGEEAGGETSEETPKKTAMAKKTPTKETPARKTPARRTPARKTPTRKTPAKKTPAKKTPAKPSPPADGGPPAEEGGVVDGVQRENGTQKPKYVRKRPAEDPVPEPQTPVEPEEEEEEETAPGGRRRRGAAKMALKYLHILAKEVLSHPDDESGSKRGGNGDVGRTHAAAGRTGSKASQKARKGKGRKRKRRFSDSDSADDEDFIPDVDEEEEEEEEEGEGTEVEEESENSDTDSAGGSPAVHVNRSHGPNIKTPNGLNTKTMRSVWDSAKTTRKFREQHHSSWVFPEWIPSSSAWKLVPHSDLESYLPQELQSAAFSVSREGLHEDETPLQRLGRFAAAPAHPDRWDMFLNAGGPVWAVEWCPTPDGASASQYIALACHRGMEDQHHLNQTYSGAGLVQLWGLGSLEYNTRPDSPPALAYGLAQDRGFIWHLKWCPAGGWELPSCGRKAPFLPRLGLLAVAASSGVVTIYSLPHPDALHSSQQQANPGEANEQLPIYKAEGVLTLKLGSIKAPRHQSSGQVLSMDWLPEKPHNIMAIGFYDGVVGLWDLATKSALLRVREFESLSLLPYRCLLAHDNAVRALAFCPASRYLLVTAGEDRYVKTWDLRRPYDPITVQKRYLTTEIYWPLNAPGLLLAQENAYAVFGSQGVHYFDHHLRPIFVVPRTGTLWSISYTEWLNSVVTADSLGEVMFSILPHFGLTPQYIKRTLERRFPVYFTSLVPHDATKDQEMGGVEGEGEQGGGPDAASEGGNESDDENGGGGGGGKDECPPLLIPTYKEAVKRYCLHHTDADMRTFTGSDKRACWKRMRDTELKAKLNMDEMPLAALHKVRFNPNMCCHTWVVSGGRTGLVRLNCLRAMISTQAKKIISENQDQFDALYSPKDQEEDVQTPKDEL